MVATAIMAEQQPNYLMEVIGESTAGIVATPFDDLLVAVK